ncbi:hypothetical protein [Leptolyngbya sp. PL-A3]|uniref:hypothetical protein n=1 Tax=Leptolyngbya sp. PL-A3 TaxID=2933911 RepID=UPI0032980A0B
MTASLQSGQITGNTLPPLPMPGSGGFLLGVMRVEIWWSGENLARIKGGDRI